VQKELLKTTLGHSPWPLLYYRTRRFVPVARFRPDIALITRKITRIAADFIGAVIAPNPAALAR